MSVSLRFEWPSHSALAGLFSLAVGTKHVHDLVGVELLHLITGRTEILPRIELARLLVEDLADSGCHGKTGIGIDVDLADSALGSLAKLLLRNTYSVRKFATVGIDDVHIFLWDGRRAMEYDRESRELLLDLVENVECEWRRDKTTGLRVPCALLRLELVCTVGCSDGDGERVATCTGSEINYLLRLGIVGFLSGNLILDTCEDTQFGLNGHIVLVCIFNDLPGEGDIVLIWEGGCIDHNGREAHVDAALAKLERIAVIEMEADLRMLPSEFLCIFNSTLCHVTEKSLVGIVACTLGNLEDYRGLCFGSSLDDSLELLHIVEIECRNGVTAFDGFCEHFFGVHEAKFFE